MVINETHTHNSGNKRSSLRSCYSVALRIIIVLSLLIGWPKEALSPAYKAPEDSTKCLGSLVWFEARGEPIKGQRAVLDVVYHRVVRSGKSYCEVLRQPNQFPWVSRYGFKELTKDQLELYNRAMIHPEMLKDEEFLFFNTVKPPGKGCRKIGRHIFCREIEKEARVLRRPL